MADESTADRGRSIDTVIRAFTDAELALRDVSGAVGRIRSASDQLDAAKADQVAAREVLAETSGAVMSVGQRVEDLTRAVADLSAAVSSLEPTRLWQRQDEQSTALQELAHQLAVHGHGIRHTTRLIWIAIAVGVAALALLGIVTVRLMTGG